MRTAPLATLLCLTSLFAGAQSTPISLRQALDMAHSDNFSIAIARSESQIADAQSKELNSLWYPTVFATGEYTHTLSEITAVTSVGALAGGVIDNLTPILTPDSPLLGIVESVADTPIRLPLVPRNTASVGIEVGWTIFSGGRRILASRIAKGNSSFATQRLSATTSATDASVVESYFTLCLAKEIVALREKNLAALTEHLRQARSLEREGMITPAERLTAKVAVEQAKASLTTARNNHTIAHNSILTLLNTNIPAIHPTTRLTLPSLLPTKEEFYLLVEQSPTIGALREQTTIATHSLSIEKGRYLPSIVLLGHQQLWSAGLNKNLFPRTAIGIGLSWTLFDGLAREGAIARSRSLVATSEIAQQKAEDDMRLAIDRLYTAMMDGIAEYEAGLSTERLAEELVRSRHKAFAEGMATSSEVVDAEALLYGAKVSQMVALYGIDTALSSLLMIVGRTDEYFNYVND